MDETKIDIDKYKKYYIIMVVKCFALSLTTYDRVTTASKIKRLISISTIFLTCLGGILCLGMEVNMGYTALIIGSLSNVIGVVVVKAKHLTKFS